MVVAHSFSSMQGRKWGWGVIVNWGQQGLQPGERQCVCVCVCVGAESRSSQSCTVVPVMMTLLLMVFGRTNTRSSFCWAPAGQLLGTKRKCALFIDMKEPSPSTLPDTNLPLYSDFRCFKEKDDQVDPRSPCPQKVLKAIHTSSGMMGKERTQTVMALSDTGNQVPPYLFPWTEGTLNPTDGVWCFSVGKGSWRNLVRRTFGIIQWCCHCGFQIQLYNQNWYVPCVYFTVPVSEGVFTFRNCCA